MELSEISIQVKAVLAVIAGYIYNEFFNEKTALLIIVLSASMILDLLLGLIRSLREGTFDVSKLRSGGNKLIAWCLLIILAHYATAVSTTLLSWFDDAVYTYIFLSEYESITLHIETMFKLKLPSLRRLKKTFQENKEVANG